MPYANNKDVDQLVHPHSLISVFIIRRLVSITPIDVISKISGLYLAPVAEQSGLSFSYVSQNKSSLSVFLQNCLRELHRICQYLEKPLDEDYLQTIIDRCSLDNLEMRLRGNI